MYTSTAQNLKNEMKEEILDAYEKRFHEVYRRMALELLEMAVNCFEKKDPEEAAILKENRLAFQKELKTMPTKKIIKDYLLTDRSINKKADVLARPDIIPAIFPYTTKKLKDNEEIFKIAMASNPLLFIYASERLRARRDYALPAVEAHPEAIGFVEGELKTDRDLALIAVRKHQSAYKLLSPEMQEDEEIKALCPKEAEYKRLLDWGDDIRRGKYRAGSELADQCFCLQAWKDFEKKYSGEAA